MNVNKHIIVAAGVIVAGGVIKKLTQPGGGAPVTPVLLGGLIFMIPLSILDLFGGGASKLASGIAMLAAVTAILTQVPWDQLFKFAGVKNT